MNIEALNKKLTEKLLPFRVNDNLEQIYLGTNNMIFGKYSNGYNLALLSLSISCNNVIKDLLFSQDLIKIELALNIIHFKIPIRYSTSPGFSKNFL